MCIFVGSANDENITNPTFIPGSSCLLTISQVRRMSALTWAQYFWLDRRLAEFGYLCLFIYRVMVSQLNQTLSNYPNSQSNTSFHTSRHTVISVSPWNLEDHLVSSSCLPSSLSTPLGLTTLLTWGHRAVQTLWELQWPWQKITHFRRFNCI